MIEQNLGSIIFIYGVHTINRVTGCCELYYNYYNYFYF